MASQKKKTRARRPAPRSAAREAVDSKPRSTRGRETPERGHVVNAHATGEFHLVKTDIRPDARGRVTIGLDIVSDRQYRALINEAGQILLDPVVTIPAREFWLWQNPSALSSVVRGVEQARRGELHDLGSFADYADLEIEDTEDDEDER